LQAISVSHGRLAGKRSALRHRSQVSVEGAARDVNLREIFFPVTNFIALGIVPDHPAGRCKERQYKQSASAVGDGGLS